MSLKTDTKYRAQIALADKTAGEDLTNNIDALTSQHPYVVAALITATATSTTTDFKSLKVGDKVLILPATAGDAQFVSVATAGTLPQAAVVGSLYVVLRAFVAP